MEAKERMNKLLLALRKTPMELANSIGKPRDDIITNVLKDKNGISRNLVYLITEKYPQVNPEWLYSDAGDMFLEDLPPPKINNKDTLDKYIALLEKTNQEQSDTIEQMRKCLKKFESLEQQPPSPEEKTG